MLQQKEREIFLLSYAQTHLQRTKKPKTVKAILKSADKLADSKEFGEQSFEEQEQILKSICA